MRVALIFGMLLTLTLAACSSASGSSNASGNELNVTMSEFKFQPSSFVMAAGQSITLRVKNAGTVDHDFAIEKLGVSLTMKPGATGAQQIGPFAPGTYDVICSIAGHKEAGMVARLTVK